jgi:hypothetical protein
MMKVGRTFRVAVFALATMALVSGAPSAMAAKPTREVVDSEYGVVTMPDDPGAPVMISSGAVPADLIGPSCTVEISGGGRGMHQISDAGCGGFGGGQIVHGSSGMIEAHYP